MGLIIKPLKPSYIYNGAGEGDRTLTTSLEGWNSTIELHPHIIWSGRRDLNSRHPPWQGGTLPLSYSRSIIFTLFINGADEGSRTPKPCGTRS